MSAYRVSIVSLSLVFASGCSGFGSSSSPSAGNGGASQAANMAIAESAHRPLQMNPPPAVTYGSVGRQATSRLTPMALRAFPAPLRAFPAPLRAFPAIGQSAAPAQNALCVASSGAKTAGCPARLRTDVPTSSASTPVELLNGLEPGAMQEIYALPALDGNAGSGRTVAVIVAFDDPVAEADLAVYRNAFGLPACTTGNGCFRKIASDGSTNYPVVDVGWALETSTDLDTVSAVCPGCNLMVVEAASSNIPDLAIAVDRAATAGADVISNSYGVPEASDNAQYNSHYNHPGIAIVASAGDRGYGVMFPASSQYVTAVGGTTLWQSGSGISESAWTGTNSGCSAFFPKPSWQHDHGCSNRTMNDVAVVADPATGMAVYDSILTQTSGGWAVVGGTSIGAPIVSSIIALGPHPEHYASARQFYSQQPSFFAITAGSNGTCTPLYLCSAGAGYSAPTGLGSPNGNHAFNT